MRRWLSSEAGSSTTAPSDLAAAPASTATEGALSQELDASASNSLAATSQGLLTPEEVLGIAEEVSKPTRFAVMLIGGTQYKVAPDDLIAVEKMELEVGQRFLNESVMMVGSADATVIGSPLIDGAIVEGIIEEQALADKVIVFKKKRRKGYRRWKGHRQPLTLVRIGEIRLSESLERELGAEASTAA